MGHLNIIGPVVIKLRFERGWSQEILAARLQCQEDDISRDVLANIEKSGAVWVAGDPRSGEQHALGFPGYPLIAKARLTAE